MNANDASWADLRSWARDKVASYERQPDGRAGLKVILVAGETAYAVTPWHTSAEPMKLRATDIAADCALPLDEVVGREYTAAGGAERLSDFRLVRDPRT